MNKLVRTAIVAVSMLTVTALAAPASSADNTAEPPAADSVADLPAARNNPHIPLADIAALPEVIQNDPDVYIAPGFDPSSPIFRPDGTLVEGQKNYTDAAKAALECGGNMTAFPAWTTQVSNCAVFGSPGLQLGYRWWAPGGNLVLVAAQGLGFDANKRRVFYSLGAATSGESRTVPWGNVLATPEFRAISLQAPETVKVTWRH